MARLSVVHRIDVGEALDALNIAEVKAALASPSLDFLRYRAALESLVLTIEFVESMTEDKRHMASCECLLCEKHHAAKATLTKIEGLFDL